VHDRLGKLVTAEAEIATVLNEHFVKVGVVDDDLLPLINVHTTVELNSISFDTNIIRGIINRLNNTSSPGPDGFPPVMFKNLVHQLADPMVILYSLIFHSGQIPDEWKRAIVKPIFKKGSSSDPNNYRPISLTSIFCKIFESCIKLQLLSYLKTNSFISVHQHGFLSKHSTTTNLLESLNDWTNSLDHSSFVKVVYTDFAKAFDVVSSTKLIYKLENQYGIRGKLLSCFKSFITGRIQCVSVGSSKSSFLPLISGVPQGSVLGPFLFLLFINDLPEICDSGFKGKLFADDAKLYNCNDYRLDPESVQHTLDKLFEWSKNWQLNLSVYKCGSLLLKGSSSFEDEHELLLDNERLNVLDEISDLGVIVDNHLTYSSHIDNIVSKANQRIFLIFKAFQSRDVSLFVFAFKTYVLPILDYCSSIWYPHKLHDIDRLESVQRYFTKRLSGLWDTSYSNRLLHCKLTSLELRRLFFDIVLCYKIVYSLIGLKFTDFFEIDKNTITRGHNLKLLIPRCKTSCRQHFFSVRIVPVWNSLSNDLVNCQSLLKFKHDLKLFDLSKFLKRDYDVFN
jgi:hypothetical protein